MNSQIDQMKEIQDKLESAEPVAVGIYMSNESLDFIVKSLRILNREKYQIDNGIIIENRCKMLKRFHARIMYSDNSSKIINLREER